MGSLRAQLLVFRNGSASDVPFSTVLPSHKELLLAFSSGNYFRREKGREVHRTVLKWISKMKKSTHGISHCKMNHVLHTACQWGAAVPHDFPLVSLEYNLSTCLTEGCQWDRSLKVEYMLCAFHFVFLFNQDWRAQYHRTEVQIFKKSLCLTYIKSHWTSYILSFEKEKPNTPTELLCREPPKISFKVNESSHPTVSDC